MKKIEELTYEEAFAELEAVVGTLENEEKTLEESLALFERGQALSKYCTALLENAELRVKQLVDGDLSDE
jgi:exodeoxyribonuclease VII small subunit